MSICSMSLLINLFPFTCKLIILISKRIRKMKKVTLKSCLSQVIIALSEKNRQHVPYRNSMMTSVLRDSLGGNCMTTMIATCSMEKRSMDVSENR